MRQRQYEADTTSAPCIFQLEVFLTSCVHLRTGRISYCHHRVPRGFNADYPDFENLDKIQIFFFFFLQCDQILIKFVFFILKSGLFDFEL